MTSALAPASVSIGPAAGKHPQDVEDACLGIALKPHTPVAAAQAPFVVAGQPYYVTHGWIAGESIERVDVRRWTGGSRRLRSRLARAVKTQPGALLKRSRA